MPQLVCNRFHQSVLDQEYNAENHADGVRGRIKKRKLYQEFLQALQDGNYDISNDNFVVFMRYKHNGILYQALNNSEQKGTVLYVNSFPGREEFVLNQYIVFASVVKYMWLL